ncbi:recombinase family protein [Arthrobacter sp. HMSC08H08]|uniref:recombinase family protein n=2 Tax=Micrococcaceae TaxID=1268 RepID=UPI003526AFF3
MIRPRPPRTRSPARVPRACGDDPLRGRRGSHARHNCSRGDTLVIRALDRVAGEERMTIEIIRELAERGVRIKSLTEPFLDVDISTPMGEAIVGIMAVMAQLPASMIRENTNRELAHAHAQGRIGGRPPVMDADRTAMARQLREEGKSYAQIGKILGVSAANIHRALNL